MNLTRLFHHLIVGLVVIGLVIGCSTAPSVNNPILVTQEITRPVSGTAHLQNSLTSTASPSVTSTQTQTAFDEAVYYATQSMVQTKVAEFPRVCTEDYSRPNFSPNGLWMEELCYSEKDRDLVMTVSNREKQTLWKLLYQDYIPTMDSVPDGGMSIVHWSLDEQYVYFNSFTNSSGGYCFGSNGVADSGMGLFRLDLNTGDITTILPATETYGWYRFSFSPTDRRLVYGARGRDLMIFDVSPGQLIHILPASNFDEGGGFVWSPDGLQFVYSTVLSDRQGAWFQHSLRLVDAQTGRERILWESADDCVAAILWTEDNRLILEKNFNESLIEFDLSSNRIISEMTATPFP